MKIDVYRLCISPTDHFEDDFDVYLESPDFSEAWKQAEHLLSFFDEGASCILFDKENDKPVWSGEVFPNGLIMGNFRNGS